MLPLFSHFILILLLEAVHHINEELHIGHVLNANALAHGINFDFKLFFGRGVNAALHSFIIDQISGFCDQEAEHLLHALVLLTSSVLVLGANTLVIDELGFGLSLLLVTAL